MENRGDIIFNNMGLACAVSPHRAFNHITLSHVRMASGVWREHEKEMAGFGKVLAQLSIPNVCPDLYILSETAGK